MLSIKSRLALLSTPALGALSLVFASRAGATSGNTCTWVGPANGGWGTPANWSCTPVGSIPGAGDTAVFPIADGGANPVEISGAQTVGAIDVTGRDYTLAASGDAGLTIGSSVTLAGSGANYLSVPVTIGSPVVFSTDSNTSVTTSSLAFAPGGSVTASGSGITLFVGPVTGPGRVSATGGTVYLESPANSFDGGSVVTAGVLDVTNAGALGAGPVAIGGSGELFFTGEGTVPNALTIGGGASPLLDVQPGALTGVTWTGPVQIAGPATIEATALVLAGAITDAPGGGGIVTFENSGIITVNDQTAPIELSNPNSSYTGGTIVAASFDGMGPILADYGTSFGTGPITIQGAGANKNAAVVELASGVTLANPIDAPGGLLLAMGDASVTGAITGSGYALGGAANGATLAVSGTLAGTADAEGRGLYVYGPTYPESLPGVATVQLNLASPATYSGQTSIDGATLDLGSRANQLPPTTQVAFMESPGSVLAVHADTAVAGLLAPLAPPAVVTLDHGATLTIALGDPSVTAQVYTGAITGDGGVVFTSDGGSSFPGTSVDGGYFIGDFNYAYTGPTRVEGNPATAATVLSLGPTEFENVSSGSIPNSTVTVTAGGELDLGPASVVGPVVGAGGTIAPYPGPATTSDAGVASVASLHMDANSALRITYAGPDAGTSFVAVNGAVSLGGARLVVTSASPLVPQGAVVVIANQSDAGVAGTFGGLPEGATVSASGDGALRISYRGGDGNDVTLEALVVDAGPDGGSGGVVDAGGDAAPGDAGWDATVGAPDAGISEDAGDALDGAMIDAMVLADAGPPGDGAPPPGDGSIATTPSTGSGCGCETAGRGGNDPRPGLFGLAAIAWIAVRRRRAST